LIKKIDYEYMIMKEYDLGKFILLKSFIILKRWFSIKIYFPKDVFWVYTKRKVRHVKLIPIGFEHYLCFGLRGKEIDEIPIRKNYLDTLLDKFQLLYPWVIVGYDKGIKERWKKDYEIIQEEADMKINSFYNNEYKSNDYEVKK